MLRIHHVISGAILAGCLSFAPDACADDDGIITLYVGGFSTLVAIPGVINFAVNAGDIGKGQKPTSGWRTGGFVMGGINVAVGGLYLGLVAPQGLGQIYAPGVAFGLLNSAVGITDIVVAAVAANMPEPKAARVQIVPMSVADIRQKNAPGLALRWNGF